MIFQTDRNFKALQLDREVDGDGRMPSNVPGDRFPSCPSIPSEGRQVGAGFCHSIGGTNPAGIQPSRHPASGTGGKHKLDGRRLGHWCFGGECSFFLISLLVLLAACSKPTEVTRSFYHWKTAFNPTHTEKATLQQLNIQRLYIKYFDVDWPEGQTQAVPQATVDWVQVPEYEVVPTVFITNRAIQKVGESGATALGERIHKLILHLHPKELPAPKEVQIDCDWSLSTRAAYFALLQDLRKRFAAGNTGISATIRLHQLKFAEHTGVPPVDRGMLMFYNMGELDDPKEDNSILSVAEGAKYMDHAARYALPLDAALPIFAWGVLIRHERPIRLLNNLRTESVQTLPWLTQLGANEFRVDTSHYLHGHYLYPGDRLRMESVNKTDLYAAAELLADKLPRIDRAVILYHLDSLTLQHHPVEELRRVYEVLE